MSKHAAEGEDGLRSGCGAEVLLLGRRTVHAIYQRPRGCEWDQRVHGSEGAARGSWSQVKTSVFRVFRKETNEVFGLQARANLHQSPDLHTQLQSPCSIRIVDLAFLQVFLSPYYVPGVFLVPETDM